MQRWKGGCVARRKSEVSPTIIPDSENRRQKEKDRSSFYYITSNKTSQGTILIAQSGPWVGEAFPKVEWTERIRTRGAPVFPKGRLGLL